MVLYGVPKAEAWPSFTVPRLIPSHRQNRCLSDNGGTLFGGSCDLGVGHGQMWVHWVSFGSDSSCIWHSVFSCQNLDLTWLCIQSRDNFYLNHRFRSATVLCQREPATLNSLCLAFAPEPTNLDLRAFTPTIHPLPTYACLRVHGNSYPCHGVLS